MAGIKGVAQRKAHTVEGEEEEEEIKHREKEGLKKLKKGKEREDPTE